MENAELQRCIQEYEDQEVSKDEIDLIQDFEPDEELSGSYAFMRSTDLIDVLSQLKCNGSIET